MAFSIVIGIFQNPDSVKEQVVRCFPVHIYARNFDSRHMRMDSHSIAKKMQLTAVQQGDVIMEQRRQMLEAKKTAAASSKTTVQSKHEDVANYYQNLKCFE